MNRITQEAKKRQAVVKCAERKAKVLLRGIRSKLIKRQKVVQAARR